MNREVHVRIWESPEVKFLRATRPSGHLATIDYRVAKGLVDHLVGCPAWPRS